jgi:ubiquinone/menaquinone biosynthesis C-methylase UbiE
MSSADYLLSDSASELERLRLQARVWEAETEAWLDHMGPMTGWRCLDLGCGAMGILAPLARRVGLRGRVLGVDIDPVQLRGARAFVAENALANVEILEADAFASPLPTEALDLTHVRFLFAPVGRDARLMNELWRLTKPGGIIAIQEPDSAAWRCYPPSETWDRLKAAIQEAFLRGGGDFDAGRRTLTMLRDRGAENVQMRAAVIALAPSHPYHRLPIQFATSLKNRILDGGLMSRSELDAAISECEKLAADPRTTGVTFVVTQVWGRKPL